MLSCSCLKAFIDLKFRLVAASSLMAQQKRPRLECEVGTDPSGVDSSGPLMPERTASSLTVAGANARRRYRLDYPRSMTAGLASLLSSKHLGSSVTAHAEPSPAIKRSIREDNGRRPARDGNSVARHIVMQDIGPYWSCVKNYGAHYRREDSPSQLLRTSDVGHNVR